VKSIPLLIVGQGIAGSCLALEALRRGVDFRLADSPTLSRSTRVAAGLFNPVVFRKVTEGWRAAASLQEAKACYAGAQTMLNESFYHPIGMWRIHGSEAEKQSWESKMGPVGVGAFLGPSVKPDQTAMLHAPFGVSEVPEAGFIETERFLDALQGYLKSSGRLIEGSAPGQHWERSENGWEWASMCFEKVVFAEGYLLQRRNDLPSNLLNPAKGEILIVEAPELPQKIINGKVYMVPLGSGRFRVGSTYAWRQNDDQPSLEKRAELILALQSMIKCPFVIIHQDAGIRPTVPDRRPILGEIPHKPGQYLFNGMGTKGVLLAPLLAREFFDFLLLNKPLPDDVRIERFYETAN
jgi:glycine oxidase